MISAARRLSYNILRQIESRRIFSDDALNSAEMKQLDLRDRHLTTEIVYGTLRWQGLLDHILVGMSSRPWPEVDSKAKTLLRMSLYQMWQMDRIPDHALVNDAVELAKHVWGRGTDRFVNGILRKLARERPWNKRGFLQEAPPWIQVSLPRWIWERWVSRFGEGAAGDFARSLNYPPQVSMQLIGRLEEPSYTFPAAIPSDLVPGAYIRISSPSEGKEVDPIPSYIQDEASQLIPHLLGPNPGTRIWDACAAPGGKSIILSHICSEKGRIFASDLNIKRISRLSNLLQSPGGGQVDILVADASAPPPFRNCFDAVLADVPCSGLGTIRRNPEIKWNFHPSQFGLLRHKQLDILSSVSEAVRRGGRLLYSTCSTEPEENEYVVEKFLSIHSDFHLVRPLHPPLINSWTGKDLMVRTYPSTRLWDAFFAALMIRDS